MSSVAVKRGSDYYQGTEQTDHTDDSEDDVSFSEVNHFIFDKEQKEPRASVSWP